jgi:hypothetical protein
MNLLRRSNQKGAPSDNASPVMIKPAIFTSHAAPVGITKECHPIGKGLRLFSALLIRSLKSVMVSAGAEAA